jgi:transposase-like protein
MSEATPTTVPRQRRYTDAEQAEAMAALVANAGNCARTAQETGIPERTIRSWKRGEARPTDTPDRQELAAVKREQLTRGVRKLTNRILRKVLKVAGDDSPVSLRDGMVALGIAVDKLDALENPQHGGAAIIVNVNPRSITLTAADVEAAKQLLAGVRAAPIVLKPLENVANEGEESEQT